MNIETFRQFALSKPGATESRPFGEDTLVYKVGGKIFSIAPLNDFPGSCNLKTDPGEGELLREKYVFITTGYHMNKKHWITVRWAGDAPDELIFGLTHNSYDLVVKSLTRKQKEDLKRSTKQSRL